MRIGSATRICTIVATLCMRESTPLRGTDCDVFRGAFYGVSAIVALNRDAHTANVTLRGLPIGGTLTGTAWHPSGVDGGEIVLEERFAAALKQRLVTLEGVYRGFHLLDPRGDPDRTLLDHADFELGKAFEHAIEDHR